MNTDRVVLRPRLSSEREEDECKAEGCSQGGDGGTPSSQGVQVDKSGKKRRYVRLADWPPAWRQEFKEWKAEANEANQRERWTRWSQELKDQVWSAVRTSRRHTIRG